MICSRQSGELGKLVMQVQCEFKGLRIGVVDGINPDLGL